jgi:hypothetical protein
MHAISQAIEDTGAYIFVCPDCGFAMDIVEIHDAVLEGGNIAEVITKWNHNDVNTKRDFT